MRAVKWKIRDDGNSTWATHFHGDYVVTVTDMDGDATEWEVWLRADYNSIPDIAKRNDAIDDVFKHERLPNALTTGYVSGAIDEFEVGKVIAIAALDAIIGDREAYEADRRANPAVYYDPKRDSSVERKK